MAVKNTKLGGIDFPTGYTSSKWVEDLNDTWDALYNKINWK